MNNPTDNGLGQTPLPLRAGNISYGRYLIAGLALTASAGLTQLGAVISVPSDSNLITSLNQVTATDYLLSLDGNVNMGGAFSLNSSTRKNIAIDGSYGEFLRGIITRSGEHNRFNVNTNGNVLSIQNSVIRQSSGTNGRGAIYVTALNSTLDLDNTLFTGNTSENGLGRGAAISFESNTSTTVDGNVTFTQNTGKGDAGGAIGVYGSGAGHRSTVAFRGKTLFEGNSTANYGGALVAHYYADVVFEQEAVFRGNYVTKYFGGAVDLYGGNTHVTFQKDAEFTGNYVRNSTNDYYGVRGGAVNVGYIDGNDAPHLDFQATATFTGNYVWGSGTTKGYGGALSMASAGANPDTNKPSDHGQYEANINRGIFENNIAYSEGANAYGGAIYTKTRNNVLTLGSGSRFTNNYAKTLGGAIYFDQGTLNLNGNMLFEGNKHGANFNTSSGRPVYVSGSGKANAIYFGVSSGTATLNLNAGAGEVIHFADPIESADKKTVTVNKTGSGTALFTGHKSDILAVTNVAAGTFELGDGASYGRIGASDVSSFSLASEATLKGGSDASLVAGEFDLAGRIEVVSGEFTFLGGDLSLHATSVVALAIESIDNYSTLNLSGQSLDLNGASLEITATNYVPSQSVSDTFTIVSNIGGEPTGMFMQGESIVINGAEFVISYNSNNIMLSQISVPEPSTYAAFAGIAIMSLVVVRRLRRKV